MKQLRGYIINEIKTRVPTLRDVRMFNNQFERSNNDDADNNDEYPFDYPCCFVEIQTEEIRPVGMGIVYMDLNILLHLGVEQYGREREEDYDLVDVVHNAINGMRGSIADTVQFSSLSLDNIEYDSNSSNIGRPVITYKTTYTHMVGFTGSDNIDKTPPTDLNLTVDIQ